MSWSIFFLIKKKYIIINIMFFSETFLRAPYIIHFDPLSVLTANKTGFCLNKMFFERFIAQSVTRKYIKKKKKYTTKRKPFFIFCLAV